jgi:hypothetical protein
LELLELRIETLEQLALLGVPEGTLMRLERNLHQRLLEKNGHDHANDNIEKSDEDPFAKFL